MAKGIIYRGRRYAWYDTFQIEARARAQAANLRKERWLAQVRKLPLSKYANQWAVYYTPRKGWRVPGGGRSK